MRDLTDDIFESWLRPATVSLDAEAIGRYRSAVANIKAKVTTETAFHLVGVAYRLPTEDARSWFLERVREADPEFVDAAQDDLIARLGCCAVFAALGVRGDTASLLCLLAQSASFLGAAPAEPELHAISPAVPGGAELTMKGGGHE